MPHFQHILKGILSQSSGGVWLYKGLPFEYNEVTNPVTGRTWMDRNLGASRVATASNDTLAYGDYFQWGRLDDLHQNYDSETTATLSTADVPNNGGKFILNNAGAQDWRDPQNDNLWQPPALINIPAPSGWRVPTLTEIQDEQATWGTANLAGAYGSVLKLPAAGFRNNADGVMNNLGSRIYLWSSTVSTVITSASFGSRITSSIATVSGARAFGFTVRLIKEI
jgi:hypothetical protein